MTRRFILPLLVLGVLFIGTCKSKDHDILPDNDCSRGLGLNRPQRPVLCVDDTGAALSVNPPAIRVWDGIEGDEKTPNMLHWVTRSKGGDLQLDFHGSNCVETPVCERGHCRARTITLTDPKEVRRCKYDVLVDGRRLDPDIVLTKCCSAEEQ